MIESSLPPKRGARRLIPIAFKVEFLQEWDRCVERGARTRMLRQYELDNSTVQAWQRARDQGEFGDSMVKKANAGAKDEGPTPGELRAQVAQMKGTIERLEAKVAAAEAAQDILGKAFELLDGITKTSTEAPIEIPPALMSAGQYAQWLNRYGMR